MAAFAALADELLSPLLSEDEELRRRSRLARRQASLWDAHRR
jgi:hypothetical protein